LHLVAVAFGVPITVGKEIASEVAGFALPMHEVGLGVKLHED
jgi:hypothetical protein